MAIMTGAALLAVAAVGPTAHMSLLEILLTSNGTPGIEA
jgi:hypothetical protein